MRITARPMRQLRRAATGFILVGAAAASAAPPIAAQLRPLEPLDWYLLRGEGTATVRLGGGWFQGQKASLAGLEGRLLEVGDVRAAWVTGRVMIAAGGTVRRIFTDYTRFAEPTGGARPTTDERLQDAGPWRVETVVRLTDPAEPLTLALRFGTRLPSTDNLVGLDRDQTDFFSVLGAHLLLGTLGLGGELGLGINGTRNPEYEQSDVLLYTLVAEAQHGPVTPSLTLTGQHDGNRRAGLRGNEDLAEVRLGLRAGRSRWFEIEVVRGLLPFSPAAGLLLGAGFAW